jgi:hypothetical protein
LDRLQNKHSDYKRLNITPVLDKIQECRRKWMQHINRMPYYRLLRILKTADQQAEETREDHSRVF